MSGPTWIDSEWVEGPDRSDGAETEQPRELGDFELLREIGRGGMGVVYEARQLSLKRRVALKVLPPLLGLGANSIERFEREAHAAAKLHHTNIVPVYFIGEQAGHHFYAMELVEGQSLDRILYELAEAGTNALFAATVEGSTRDGSRGGSASGGAGSVTTSRSDTSMAGRKWFDTVARMMADVADALAHAHERGVIHRDIKPGNLLLSDDGRLMVTDFGLARLSEETSLTLSGSLMGTPAYMSPEQIAAGRMGLDHRTDIYSLGAVLYEMLTLRRPFPGESREEVIAGIMTKDPRSPRRHNHRIPLDLETICLKAMEKDPGRRYATAGELAGDLRQYLQRGLITARRAGPLRRTAKAIRRHPVAATIVVCVIVLAGAAAGLVQWTSYMQAREEARRAVATAKAHLGAGLYREGLDEVERVLALDPDSAPARLVRARLLIELDRTQEAAREAEALLERNSEDWMAHLILASAAKDLPGISAEEHIRIVEEHAPRSADAYYLRSLVAESSEDRLELLGNALDLHPAHAEALLDRIQLYVDDFKDHPAALLDCERLIGVRPRSAQGRRMRARVYQDQRDYDKALAEIERAIELDPLDPSNLATRAEMYRDLGRHAQSVASFSQAIKLDPEHAPFYSARSTVHNEAGAFEQAVVDSRRAIELHPALLSAHGELFHAYLRLDQKEELRTALSDLQAAADGWADQGARAWAYREVATYLGALKDHEHALATADRAIAIDPDDYRGFITRAGIRRALKDEVGVRADCDAAQSSVVREPKNLGRRGERIGWTCERWKAGLRDHNQFVDTFPNWHLPYFHRGTTLILLGRLEQALDDFNRAIELAPNSPSPYTNRSHIFWELNRFEDALADLSKAIELDPHDSPYQYMNRGFVHFRLGHVEEALRDADKSIDLDPRFADAYSNRGIVLGFLGECGRAMEDVRKAEELGASDGYAQQSLAGVHLNGLRHGCPDLYDVDLALEYAARAYEALPAGADSTYGHALYRQGRYEEARAALLPVHERKQGRGAWFLLAMCSWQLGDRVKARELYDRSIVWMDGHNPNDPVLIGLRHEATQLLQGSR